MAGLRWQTGEDWYGFHAKASIGGLTVKVDHKLDQRVKFCVMDDEKCLVKGETDDWSVAIQRAQTATALILKARTKACPIDAKPYFEDGMCFSGR